MDRSLADLSREVDAALKAAHELLRMLPEGRAKSIAFTKLDEARLWALVASGEVRIP